ncbi:hypothetical protein E1292_28370 [Nonomuraea deserti]|uniref:Uncharacterized protein n=1 Tax=Nonomuraea deserti TaxID=1848322 RepID=A0A4R4V6S6_9ACTN|nr:hypothetical protein [Nonomuraea deserti]TDD00572.1 hypothetical protein E1292_28370 [Nonomuraea deserti]
MNDPTKLAKLAADYAAQNSLVLVPAIPETGIGPEVYLDPDTLELPAFLSLARKIGGCILYLRSEPFDPYADEDDIHELPTHLAQHVGQVGQVSVAFMANGLVHFWQQSAAWYLDWQRVLKESSGHHGLTIRDEDDQLSVEERERSEAELIDRLLADPEFRAARASARQRIARLSVPPDAQEWSFWDAIRTACERADALAKVQYIQLGQQLDGLAAELLADPEYRVTSSPAARKQLVDRFLISRADGFSGPSYVRDELYARVQQLRKSSTAGVGVAGSEIPFRKEREG